MALTKWCFLPLTSTDSESDALSTELALYLDNRIKEIHLFWLPLLSNLWAQFAKFLHKHYLYALVFSMP